MLISSEFDAVSPVSPTKQVVPVSSEHETPAVQEPKYDSVTIAPQTEEGRFRQELVSRLSKEVRTAVSTGDIQQLKQAVEEDTYPLDPMRTAGKILLLDEEEL